MKYVYTIIIVSIISITGFSQSNEIIQPQLNGYKLSDIVKYDDFIKNGKLTTNSSEFKVVGFTFMVWAGDVQEYKSDSCTITNEMRKVLEELKSKGFKTCKIYFHNIKVRNPKGKIKTTGDLIYKLTFD